MIGDLDRYWSTCGGDTIILPLLIYVHTTRKPLINVSVLTEQLITEKKAEMEHEGNWQWTRIRSVFHNGQFDRIHS